MNQQPMFLKLKLLFVITIDGINQPLVSYSYENRKQADKYRLFAETKIISMSFI